MWTGEAVCNVRYTVTAPEAYDQVVLNDLEVAGVPCVEGKCMDHVRDRSVVPSGLHEGVCNFWEGPVVPAVHNEGM